MSSTTNPRRKHRTKTFTGCWTCRSRHVKCDEQRPHCQRCLQNGWQCEGYHIRLEWSGTTRGSGSQKRRLANPMRLPPEQCLSSKDVTALLADLDNNSDVTAPYERGPFTVFPAFATGLITRGGSGTGSGSDGGDASVHTSINTESLDADPEDDPCTISVNTHTPSSSSLRLDHTKSESSANSSKMLSTPTRRPDSERDSPAIAVPSEVVYENQDLERHIVEISKLQTTADFPQLKPGKATLSLARSISPYAMSKLQIELVHHWVTFISGNVLLIDTPDNPCRTIFVPLALQGVDLGQTESSMYRTIFHAICSASAFSLYHLRNDDRYQSLALTHDQLALHHLRHNLNAGAGVNELTLAAICSCITVEAISGRRHRWRTHLVGALSLLEKDHDSYWAQSAVASSMLQSSLSLSSLCSLRVPTHLVSHLDGPPEMSDYLERSHGMTRPLVRFLANLTDKFESKGPITTEELDRLELQLYLSFPRLSTTDGRNAKLIQHAVNAFYYAAVIYFRRTIRRVPSAAVQDLVEKAVEDLEAAESLSQGKAGTAYNWPGLIVGAECGSAALQDRMLTWFHQKRRHGLRSVSVIRDLVTVLWRRRTTAGSDVHWQEVAKEENLDIMFV